MISLEAHMSICEQCRFFGFSRSTYYYPSVPNGETEENMAIMKRIDELYLDKQRDLWQPSYA